MDFEQLKNNVIPKRYLVSDYFVKYKNEFDEINRILVPNLHGKVLNRHEVKELSIRYIKKNTQSNNPIFISYEKHGKCAFCLKFGKLERSHVIGNTVFKTLFKKCENGQAIKINLDEKKKIMFDSNSWAIEMLCKNCESMFNRNFEDYSISVLRNKCNSVQVTEFFSGLSLKGLDSNRFLLYIISLFWRAAYSIENPYKNVKITYGVDSYFRSCISGNLTVLPKICNLRVRKLFDSYEILDESLIKEIIINPFIHIQNKEVAYYMLYEGYLFEFYLIAPSFKRKKQQGFLKHNNDILFVPYIDIFSIEKIAKEFARAIQFHNNSISL